LPLDIFPTTPDWWFSSIHSQWACFPFLCSSFTSLLWHPGASPGTICSLLSFMILICWGMKCWFSTIPTNIDWQILSIHFLFFILLIFLPTSTFLFFAFHFSSMPSIFYLCFSVLSLSCLHSLVFNTYHHFYACFLLSVSYPSLSFFQFPPNSPHLPLSTEEAQRLPYYATYCPIRLLIHSVCTSHYLDIFITFIICLNVVTMSLEHYNQPVVSEIVESNYTLLLQLSNAHCLPEEVGCLCL